MKKKSKKKKEIQPEPKKSLWSYRTRNYASTEQEKTTDALLDIRDMLRYWIEKHEL